MKNLFKSIKAVFADREELATLRSWSKYLEGEVDYLNRKLLQDKIALADLVTENERISGANTKLIREAASARSVANRIRDKQIETAATPKERELLEVCANIYRNGKVIKKRTFVRMVGAAINERRNAVTNREGVWNYGGLSSQGGGVSTEGN